MHKLRSLNIPLWRVFYMLPCSKRFTFIVSVTTILIMVCMFIPLIRNTLLYPIWPKPWRDITTFEIMSIKLFPLKGLDNDGISCSAMKPTTVKRSDIDTTKVIFYPFVHTIELRHPEHERFLPTITNGEKVTMLHTYLVVADTLQKANIEFFMVEGSLLGVHRHHGMVPWDDDIDIAVSVILRKLVRGLLGCIEDFVLDTKIEAHWKFFQNTTQPRYGFPFIDIFFYTEDEDYVWAVTHYLLQSDIFPKKHTFPLANAKYEGIIVPVPKDIDYIIRSVFDLEMCQSPSYSHKMEFSISSSNMSYIRCSSLTYMFNLKY